MRPSITIIVADAAPLIYLAAGGSLDYLLYPNLPVLVPDAVFHEATAATDKLGALAIIDWYRAHPSLVRIEPTSIFQREITVLETLGSRLPRDLGERAALEVVRSYPLADNERAMLLSDDRDAERLSITDPRRLVLIGTFDFLQQLEGAQRIQSADAVLAAAQAVGVTIPKRDLFSRHDPEVRESVMGALKHPRT